MLDTDTKRRIDTARDILVGKVPDPKSQVEQITIALIYKFMDDMDAESEELGGKRKFFTEDPKADPLGAIVVQEAIAELPPRSGESPNPLENQAVAEVGAAGLEPTTPGFGGRYSIQMSYAPEQGRIHSPRPAPAQAPRRGALRKPSRWHRHWQAVPRQAQGAGHACPVAHDSTGANQRGSENSKTVPTIVPGCGLVDGSEMGIQRLGSDWVLK